MNDPLNKLIAKLRRNAVLSDLELLEIIKKISDITNEFKGGCTPEFYLFIDELIRIREHCKNIAKNKAIIPPEFE